MDLIRALSIIWLNDGWNTFSTLLTKAGVPQFLSELKVGQLRCPQSKVFLVYPEFFYEEDRQKKACITRGLIFLSFWWESINRCLSQVWNSVDYALSILVNNFNNSFELWYLRHVVQRKVHWRAKRILSCWKGLVFFRANGNHVKSWKN